MGKTLINMQVMNTSQRLEYGDEWGTGYTGGPELDL